MTDYYADSPVSTQRGLAARVKPKMAKRTIYLGVADTLTGRMPTRAEQVSLGLDDGVPVIEVRRADGRVDLYQGDEFQVAVAAEA